MKKKKKGEVWKQDQGLERKSEKIRKSGKEKIRKVYGLNNRQIRSTY